MPLNVNAVKDVGSAIDTNIPSSNDEPRAQIRWESVRMVELLGAGQHGLVIRGSVSLTDTFHDVAIKIPSSTHSLEHEAEMLRRFAHPNVVKVLGGPVPNGALFLELCDEGTLATRAKSIPLTSGQATCVLRDMVEALRRLHQDGWLHGDVSPSNIGLRSNGGAALLDFATARPADGSRMAEGTAEFAGPIRHADHLLDIRSLAAAVLASLDGSASSLVGQLTNIVERCDAGEAVHLHELTREPPPPSDGVPRHDPPRPADLRPYRELLTIARTRSYGPQPGDGPPCGESDNRPRRPRAFWVVAIALFAMVLIGVESSTGPPTVNDQLNRDDPRQVVAAVQTLRAKNMIWDDTSGTVEIHDDGGNIVRFQPGQPGDLAAVADWNCNGVATLGVYRPLTGNWFVFESWSNNASSTVEQLDMPDRDIAKRLFVERSPERCDRPLPR